MLSWSAPLSRARRRRLRLDRYQRHGAGRQGKRERQSENDAHGQQPGVTHAAAGVVWTVSTAAVPIMSVSAHSANRRIFMESSAQRWVTINSFGLFRGVSVTQKGRPAAPLDLTCDATGQQPLPIHAISIVGCAVRTTAVPAASTRASAVRAMNRFTVASYQQLAPTHGPATAGCALMASTVTVPAASTRAKAARTKSLFMGMSPSAECGASVGSGRQPMDSKTTQQPLVPHATAGFGL
jgi:hypothetical protein